MSKAKLQFVMPNKPEDIDGISGSLLKFYKDLGWNPDDSMLNVRKIKITQNAYKEISSMYMSVDGAGENISAFLMNYMPSATGDTPGFVEIEDGAF